MKKFDKKLFKSPGSRFRGLPFWAWNTDVTEEKVTHQIEIFKKMGFGGFIIHARKGLRTEYMGEHFMDMVRLSIEKAKELDLRVWLYDEDGWPSGCAGGKVTVDKKYRQKTLLFTKEKLEALKKEEAIRLGEPYLLACFDISLDTDGYLKEYKQTAEHDGCIRAYVMTAPNNPRFNGQAYIDTMNRAAVERFLEITYDKYFDHFGEEFGKTVEAIFTDEPQLARIPPLAVSDLDSFCDASISWSDDFPETYKQAYKEDIVSRLPEIFWELPSGHENTVRYRFHAHTADRFREAFSKPIGAWCEKHGIKFTGHYMLEETLESQTLCLRDDMRNYADQGIPGIDVLLGGYEFTTALQCRSVAQQSGKTQIMSELYGVTNHTSDFRDYIHLGNWQAALGVTERVPHLTWMSMLGEGKRDYPANFGYQSPWYRDFTAVEDHFARLNTLLHSGDPSVRVGVIHPIESHWLIYGPNDKTGSLRKARDERFHNICEWLLFDCIDFDYINESLLPEQFDGKRSVGKMSYDAIVVPDCLTLRKSTVKILEKLKENGVRIIFMGNIPSLIDGTANNCAEKLAEKCDKIAPTYESLTSALSDLRSFELFDADGMRDRKHIYRERLVGDERFIFITPATTVSDKEDTSKIEYTVKLFGEYIPTVFNTFSGEEDTLAHEYKDGKTLVYFSLASYDSLLLHLKSGNDGGKSAVADTKKAKNIRILHPSSVKRAEDNVLLLDMAKYSLDGNEYFEQEEILRIDTACRKILGLPSISGKISPQPWTVNDDVKKSVFLKFEIECDKETEAFLAFERAKAVKLNGESVDIAPIGYYVDKDISKIFLPRLKKGRNILDAEVIISKTVGVEPMYLLGDFDVELRGTKKKITETSESKDFGNATDQGMPFYSGDIIYEIEIDTPEGDLELSATHYRGALLKVSLDGEDRGNIILPPYRLKIPKVEAGKHTLTVICRGNRHNTFGSLHWAIYDPYFGPRHWHKTGDAFSYSYKLCETGILSPLNIITSP